MTQPNPDGAILSAERLQEIRASEDDYVGAGMKRELLASHDALRAKLDAARADLANIEVPVCLNPQCPMLKLGYRNPPAAATPERHYTGPGYLEQTGYINPPEPAREQGRCRACQGTGDRNWIAVGQPKKCEYCNGTGKSEQGTVEG